MDSRKRVTLNRIFTALLGIALLTLALSFSAEKFWGLPCTLCKLQRIPYFLIAANAFIGIFVSIKRGVFRTIQLYLLAGVLLGGFHTAVWFGKPNTPCSRITEQTQEAQDNTVLPVSRPKYPKTTWTIFGIPVSLYNSLLSLSLLIGSQYVVPSSKKLLGK